MSDEFEDQLVELVDYATNTKEPQWYSIFDIATGYDIIGSKWGIEQAIKFYLDMSEPSLRLCKTELRDKDDVIVLAIVENVITGEDYEF